MKGLAVSPLRPGASNTFHYQRTRLPAVPIPDARGVCRIRIEATMNRRRPPLTIVDVARACVSLQKQRRSFGPTNVRLELERGSYRDITRYLRRLALIDFRARRRLSRPVPKDTGDRS